ncbi:MAG: T9SS type A sorting domain-containing protein, partial [Bacteroidota bacterium]
IYQLNSEEITTLQSIAPTNTSAALAAQGILTLVNGEVYNGIIERVEDEQMLTSVHSNKNLSDTWMEINIRIYPNPANQSVLVNYELTELHLNEAASVQIMDITGKQLMLKKLNSPKGIVELSTSSFSNGIYFIQLYSGSLLIATQKVIIHH